MDAILYEMQTNGINNNNHIYDKLTCVHELVAPSENVEVRSRSRRRRRDERQMVVLEGNEDDNNPPSSYTSKYMSNKQQYQLGGVIKNFCKHYRAAVSLKKEVPAVVTSELHCLQIVNNVISYHSPSKQFLQSILNPPSIRVSELMHEINGKGATTKACILAAKLDDSEAIQRFATAGMDLNITDSLGHTALTWATILNRRDAAMALIACGANIKVRIIIT